MIVARTCPHAGTRNEQKVLFLPTDEMPGYHLPPDESCGVDRWAVDREQPPLDCCAGLETDYRNLNFAIRARRRRAEILTAINSSRPSPSISAICGSVRNPSPSMPGPSAKPTLSALAVTKPMCGKRINARLAAIDDVAGRIEDHVPAPGHHLCEPARACYRIVLRQARVVGEREDFRV